MEFEPEVGSIIEFDDGDAHRLAVVVDTIGHQKLSVVTPGGDRMRTTADEISFELGSSGPTDPERAKRKLEEIDETIEGRRADVDLEMLWEFVRDDHDRIGATELAEVMFADESPETIVAILRSLRDNTVYFKHRREFDYEPRSEGQVEELRRQREARLEKQREHNRILETIADILDAPESERAPAIDEAMGDDDALRDAIHTLQDFAAEGNDFDRKDDAEQLLADLLETADHHLDGSMDLKAFYLMVELGLWDEHHNLAMERFNVSRTFPTPLVERAETVADEIWEPEAFREDYTDWTTITIDAASSRDLDDALSCRPLIDGGWDVAIHITDPSAFVDDDGELDRRARRRGTSLYLPTGTVPMFPPALSEQKMSLLPDRRRPALTTRIRFDENLEIVDTELTPSVICVDRRLSYDDVDELLDEESGGRWADLVKRLEFIADESHNQRTEDAGAYFDLPETKIDVEPGDPPRVDVRVVDTETRSRGLVSELMILNNDVVGRFCARHEIPAIFRTQPPPERPLFDEEIEAIPEGVARTFAQIWRMNPGETTSQPGTHFGLGLNTYAQASSPIRRYADLICQRQIKAFLADEPLPYDEQQLLEVLGSVKRAVSKASTIESDTERYWMLYWLAHRQEPMEAVVIDHYDDRGSRAAVFLEDCAYRSKCALRSDVAVGEKLTVTVEQADPRRDILSLREK